MNLEAERRVAQLNDEVQGLVRGLKAKDQHIQEAAVKIELMERRMEGQKKQGETIADLEAELTKARKQERTYEEAMEQLQGEYDALEQENAKLKTMAPVQEKAGEWGPNRNLHDLDGSTATQGAQVAEPEPVAVEQNLETSYLLDQVRFHPEFLVLLFIVGLQLEALRGTVRFLRTENSYLKGQDLLKEIQSLLPLPERIPTPPLDPSLSELSDESDEDEPRPPTLRSLATETKMLYRDVIQFSSSPRVVDLSTRKTGRAWVSKKSLPVHQVWERKMEAERLGRRVRGLMERARAIGE